MHARGILACSGAQRALMAPAKGASTTLSAHPAAPQSRLDAACRAADAPLDVP